MRDESGAGIGYYFETNPRQVSARTGEKIFKYCIVCGSDRFPGQSWESLLPRVREFSPLNCSRPSCWETAKRLRESLPEALFRA